METISRHLEDLTAFHVVALEGSYTRASEKLGNSKALLSKQVKRLETYIGSQLFHRTTRSLSLTEEGAALFSYSQKIFELSDEATRRLRDLTHGSIGSIRISAPVSVGEVFFPAFLDRMSVALPYVKFELDLSNENKDIAKDGIDFAIRASSDHHPDLVTRYLGRIKDVVCVNPKFLNSSKINESPTSLVYQDCILNSFNAQWNAWSFQSERGEVRVDVHGKYATNQYGTARLLCLEGRGVSRLPLYLVSDDLREGRLVQLFSDYEITTHPLYLVYLQSKYASKKHKLIKEVILKWFGERKDYFV